jgi:hypothetical protein
MAVLPDQLIRLCCIDRLSRQDLPGLGRLVVLPVACVIRLDYKARENLLSEETSVTDTNPNSSRDLFR